jgi:eukaryotic-like serine/threonine-protein kinase
LGDYLLVRQVGRGGMGVVYEAVQRSLGRRVALKVLPFAAALDPRQLQRFHNEAQAAAQLHHPHIVPVHGLGCERGVHYYVMQFIEGHTLAEAIAQVRAAAAAPAAPAAATPAATALSTDRSARSPAYFRAVARLGVQAAEALEHAHQCGVVHRDVKPANLLLDAAGQLWVTDFGLARYRTDQGLTLTGDAVGTLRYMSPEQALAKRGLVDHRSDVYSLGLTLYEALALEPAYPGSDREELLRQIAWGEPGPLRRLNPAVPVELETVVLKAMAREPERRYATAQELADDLKRFLEHRPVRAKRPSLRERLAKWAWRHRSVVTVAAAVAVTCLLATTLVVWREKEQTKAALKQAQAQGRRADGNFQKALDGAMRMLVQLDPKPDRPPLEGDKLRRALVEQGLNFFRQFINEESDDPAVLFESARAYQLMANVYLSQKNIARARAMMATSYALLEGLMSGYPQDEFYRKELIQAHYQVGIYYRSLKHADEAREEFARAVGLIRAARPRDARGDAQNTYAWLLVDCPDETLRDPARAVALAKEAVTLAPAEGKYWNTLGVAHYRAGDWAAAREALEKSMELSGGGSAYDWLFLAMTAWQTGDRQRARAWFDQAVRWMGERNRVTEELLRYRAEAAKLLGVPEPGPPNPKDLSKTETK